MASISFTKKIAVKKEYDIIVCGGGVAGVAAAITARTLGASVLLIEKSNILGGLGTLGLINLFVPMCNGRGKQIIFGLCEKWARLSASLGYDTIPKEWKNGEPSEPTNVRYVQRYSPHIFALQLMDEVTKAGVDLLYDCLVCDPVMEGKICKGVITESKSGTEYYSAKMVIDTTGDCDVLRRGGVPTVSGENFYTYIGKKITLESCRLAAEKGDIKFAFSDICGGNINLWGDNQPSDKPKWSGLTVDEVTDYLITNQKAILSSLKSEDRETHEITHLPMMPQLRTTCHIKGDYSLKVEDAYQHFEDSVCAINDFEHRDHLWEVPLRTLTRKDYPNMLTAGRSADGTGYGWDLLRVIPVAILTGQAAAHAAVLAINSGMGVAEVDIKALQENLTKDNVMIHFPDELVPEDKTIILHGKNAAEIDGGHW
ncbi:MAG: FAD-dependent oxidoreductase [Clostridia bacterium]|nr:FAD-dependent oxidoreductase [Clostridia bacterium]